MRSNGTSVSHDTQHERNRISKIQPIIFFLEISILAKIHHKTVQFQLQYVFCFFLHFSNCSKQSYSFIINFVDDGKIERLFQFRCQQLKCSIHKNYSCEFPLCPLRERIAWLIFILLSTVISKKSKYCKLILSHKYQKDEFLYLVFMKNQFLSLIQAVQTINYGSVFVVIGFYHQTKCKLDESL